VFLLEEEELLDAAVGVVALVVPGVGGVVFLVVCVGVGGFSGGVLVCERFGTWFWL